MSSHVIENNVEALLEEFYGQMGKSYPEILRQIARAEAVSYARSTQPYTSGDDWGASQKQGMSKVDRDVRKVYAAGGDVFTAIKNSGDEGLADAFYYFYQTGQINGKRGAQSLMQASKTPFAGLRIEKLNPSLHQSARGRGGRVAGSGKRFKQVVKHDGQLDKYVEGEQKKVGWVKSAWSNCARLLGGAPSEVPAWAKKGASPCSVSDNSKDAELPYVTMQNMVPYASDALPPGVEADALKGAHDRLALMVEHAMIAQAKKTNAKA